MATYLKIVEVLQEHCANSLWQNSWNIVKSFRMLWKHYWSLLEHYCNTRNAMATWLEHCWNALSILWKYCGNTVGTWWESYWNIVRTLLACCGNIFAHYWNTIGNAIGTCLGHFWYTVEIPLEYWGNVLVTLGTLWEQYMNIVGTLGMLGVRDWNITGTLLEQCGNVVGTLPEHHWNAVGRLRLLSALRLLSPSSVTPGSVTLWNRPLNSRRWHHKQLWPIRR